MIAIMGVSKSFQSNESLNKVLEDVSFQVNKGEIVTLLGKSGCGKSTLLHIVGGFEKSDKGKVLQDQQLMLKPSKKCMMLFQHSNLLPWRTALKNIELGLDNKQKSKEEIKNRAMEALKLVGLEKYAYHFPHELSGGMQQRVAIARAFAMEPDVILMDEPFAALDTFNRYHLQDELVRIQKQKRTTILLVTHDIDEAVYLSDRVCIMDSNPGSIFREVKINLPKPRDRANEDYNYYRKTILKTFELSGPDQTLDYTI